MVEIIKALRLNILSLTNRKDSELHRLIQIYSYATNDVFELCEYWDEVPKANELFTRYNVQKLIYHTIKAKYGLQAQLIVDLIKDVVICFKNNGNRIDYIPVSFNIPRSGKFAKTKLDNPVISIASFNGRMAIPIAQDGAYARFKTLLADGYKTTNFRVGKENGSWILIVNIRKEVPTYVGTNILGVDCGSRTLATVSIIEPNTNKIIKQLYFGRDVWETQRNICIRRSKLKSYVDNGNRRAMRLLRKLRTKETNFNKTRSYQIAHQIADLAREHNCSIAIEDLNGLKDSNLSKKSNRRVKRMPYHTFRVALESVCAQNGLKVIKVNPYHTSKRCSRCGNIGCRKGKGKLFVCKCGLLVNADRNASVNIALDAKTAIFSYNTQTIEGNLAVAPSVCSYAIGMNSGLHP